jgi:hypothetical protein
VQKGGRASLREPHSYGRLKPHKPLPGDNLTNRRSYFAIKPSIASADLVRPAVRSFAATAIMRPRISAYDPETIARINAVRNPPS